MPEGVDSVQRISAALRYLRRNNARPATRSVAAVPPYSTSEKTATGLSAVSFSAATNKNIAAKTAEKKKHADPSSRRTFTLIVTSGSNH
jgi:hypothetical protein